MPPEFAKLGNDVVVTVNEFAELGMIVSKCDEGVWGSGMTQIPVFGEIELKGPASDSLICPVAAPGDKL